jgi:hypothetical protein
MSSDKKPASYFQPNPGHPTPAIFRLTREFLAEVAPSLDADTASFADLAEHLGGDAFYSWLAQYPDRELVAQYYREEGRSCDGMVADLMTKGAASGSEMILCDENWRPRKIVRPIKPRRGRAG